MSWLEQPRLCSVWEHWTVRGCTGQCPVRQAGSCELAALGISSTAHGYNSPDCPVSQRSAARSAQDTWSSQRSGGGTGQCLVRQRLSGANGRLRHRKKEIRTGQCPVCTGQCPVRQTTEGKNCLPRLFSTAPSCLGAIKGTPRHMEDETKHSLSILDHSHSIRAHLFDILVI
jgi:hypothetical protein